MSVEKICKEGVFVILKTEKEGMSITALAGKTKSSWETVKKYLSLLEAEGRVKSISKGTAEIYSVVSG